MIGSGSHFDGLLTFRGAARVDGTITGTIHATGRLEIGPGAHVQAQVEVDVLVVEGLLEGEVWAHERAELLPSGQVVGNLVTPRVKVAEGGILQGSCRTSPEPPPAHAVGSGPEGVQAPDSATESP